MTYKYILDPSSKKYYCPECHKKRFVRYVNTETGQYFEGQYGRCDREVKCGYHQKPNKDVCFTNIVAPRIELPTYYIPIELFNKSLSNYSKNNMVKFLNLLFDAKKVNELIGLYHLGTSKKWPGACIFWQLSIKGKIGQGKIMLLDSMTGKRVKQPYPHISSVHKQLGKEDQKPALRFFGEHLLTLHPKKPIAIVESEKTAIVMTGFNPSYNWVASGSLSNINSKRMQAFKHKNTTLYPDLGCFEKWSQKATNLNKMGFQVSVSDLLEKKATKTDKEAGFDIADYCIKNKLTQLDESEALPKMKQKNHNLQLLIDSFQMVEISPSYHLDK